jgi:membrane associated rhomboid family serine protease
MFRNLTPAVRALLIANVGVFILTQYVFDENLWAPLALWPLHSAGVVGMLPFEPWQLLTYAFLHANFLHIFTNMFALWMFGPDTERLLGTRRFWIYYLVCVLGAALTQTWVTAEWWPASGPTVGASGGIFGVLLCYGMAYPYRKLILLPVPIPMPAWLFVTLYGVLELLLGIFGTGQGIAHFAHLGGMAAGYLLIRYWQARRAPRP